VSGSQQGGKAETLLDYRQAGALGVDEVAAGQIACDLGERVRRSQDQSR